MMQCARDRKNIGNVEFDLMVKNDIVSGSNVWHVICAMTH